MEGGIFNLVRTAQNERSPRAYSGGDALGWRIQDALAPARILNKLPQTAFRRLLEYHRSHNVLTYHTEAVTAIYAEIALASNFDSDM
jgi:hypothetical protein